MQKFTYDALNELKAEVSKQKQTIAILTSQIENAQYVISTLIERNLEAVFILDAETKRVLYVNQAALNLFQRDSSSLLHMPFGYEINFNSPQEVTIPRREDDDHKVFAQMYAMMTYWEGKHAIIVSFRDVTLDKKSQAFMDYLSSQTYFSDLTERQSFELQITQAIEAAQIQNTFMSILYIELTNIGDFIENCPETLRDHVLQEVAIMLKATVRDSDVVTRIDDDKFALILGSLQKPSFAEIVAAKILVTLSQPFLLDGHEIRLQLSMGIATYPLSGTNSVTLFKNAGIAAYQAKKQGLNHYHHYLAD